MTSDWTRGSFCSVGACIEVKRLPSGARILRSTTTGEYIHVLGTEWEAFTLAVKADEFEEGG